MKIFLIQRNVYTLIVVECMEKKLLNIVDTVCHVQLDKSQLRRLELRKVAYIEIVNLIILILLK